ncbi:MAG: hypothetical protein RMJ66_00490 [Bacteroidia bacterium]|nr:hypothetical protein [Bacteroidia bacterium]MDW8133522.1 hypothetical protein [Bacteroidia bacterium]
MEWEEVKAAWKELFDSVRRYEERLQSELSEAVQERDVARLTTLKKQLKLLGRIQVGLKKILALIEEVI